MMERYIRFDKVTIKTLIYLSQIKPLSKNVDFTVYGYIRLTISSTAHLSWILILHETLSRLWLQMKSSLGVTAEECKTRKTMRWSYDTSALNCFEQN